MNRCATAVSTATLLTILTSGCGTDTQPGAPISDAWRSPAPDTHASDSGPPTWVAPGQDGQPATGDAAPLPGTADATVTTPPPPPPPPPECTNDGHCGGDRRCLSGICRDKCMFGVWCPEGTPSGERCHQGHCVACAADHDCPGSRYRCDTARYACVEQGFDPTLTKIGIFYHTWHCPIVNHKIGIYDISQILAGQQGWGPERHFHFWDEPAAGYYCLSQNDAVLTKHAQQLTDAGIDFVFLDMTNHAYADHRSDRTQEMIIKPLERMLAVWSKIPSAPKIVPWVPIHEDHADPGKHTVDAVLARMGKQPQLHFNYLGKPLIMVTENSAHPVSAARVKALSASYTLRRMWAFNQPNQTQWSFIQDCRHGSPKDPAPCDQSLAVDSAGAPEQLAITTAYQATYMSLPTATPKHKGLTFRKQFEALFNNPTIPIATITSWNEWMSQRIPCGENPACPCAQHPTGCFTDAYDAEYNRDIEPAKNAMGDYYYRLLKACIALFRAGGRCDAAHASDLCCKAWTP